MQLFIGTKLIRAVAMTRLAYNEMRNWQLPVDENGEDEGYLVEYLDGGEANTTQYIGYVSWSPKKQFEDAYRVTDGMNFGLAVEAMKKGCKVARTGWNGKNMYVFLVSGSNFKVNRAPLNTMFPEGTEINYKPHMDMCHADGSIGVWNAVTNDQLADDWYIVV